MRWTDTWEKRLNLVLNLTASSTATPSAAPGPRATPTAAPKTGLNVERIIGLTIFGIFDILLIGALVYLVWRFFIQR